MTVWKCPRRGCRKRKLGPVHGTVASCPRCGRGYVCVTDEERAVNQAAMKARRKPRRNK